jgi:hypothetical protein
MKAHFTIIAISKNTNAFGHREFLFLAPCGTGWRATRSLYSPDPQPKAGDTLEFDALQGPSSRRFETWECPRTLASVPPKFARKVIDEARTAAQLLES